jgi:arylformamidase
VHLGAHADAPSHYGADARTIDEMPLARYLGPARVLRVSPRTGRVLQPGDLTSCPPEERVLLATGSACDPSRFDPAFTCLSPELIESLHAAGLRLVGVDTPSVDAFDSKDLPVHRACLRLDVAILEGLVLAGVPEGRYELIALPLRLCGFDASPVRAILRALPAT